MKLYAGTTKQFRADAPMLRIAEKLRAESTVNTGERPGRSDVASRQNSLVPRSVLVDQAQLNSDRVLLLIGSAGKHQW